MWKAPEGGRRPLHVVYAGGSGNGLIYWLIYEFSDGVKLLDLCVCGLKFVLIWFKIGVESKLEEVLDGS